MPRASKRCFCSSLNESYNRASAGRTIWIACIIASRRCSTASSRASGVSGGSLGQDAATMELAFEEAAARSSRAADCEPVGWVASRIRLIGKLVTSPVVAQPAACATASSARVLSGHEEAGATRTKSLPKFSPRRRPMRARGAFSSPSITSSRYLIRPSPTQAETSRIKSP